MSKTERRISRLTLVVLALLGLVVVMKAGVSEVGELAREAIHQGRLILEELSGRAPGEVCQVGGAAAVGGAEAGDGDAAAAGQHHGGEVALGRNGIPCTG